MSAVDKVIKFFFRGENELSTPSEKAAQSLDDLSRQKKELDNQLKDISAQQKLIKKYNDLEATLGASEQAFDQAKKAASQLAQEISIAGVPTEKLRREFKEAQEQVDRTSRALNTNKNQLAKLGPQVTATVSDIKNLTLAEAQLKAESGRLGTASRSLAKDIKATAREEVKLKAEADKTGTASRALAKDLKVTAAATEEVAEESKGLAGSWGEVAAKGQVFIAAIVGAGLALKGFLGSNAETQYQNQKLTDTLQRNTGATLEQVQAVKAQAEALQTVTRFSDEETKAAQSKLATYKLTAAQVMDLTPLLLDMAESKRESSDADADSIGSAEAIGDAIRDNITALESFGVHITDAQEEQHKNSTMAERHAMVMDILAGTFKGAAEAAGKDFAGQVDIAANKTKDAISTWAGFITQNKAVQALIKETGDLFATMGKSAAEGSSTAQLSISFLAGALSTLLNSLRGTVNFIDNIWLGLKAGVLASAQAMVTGWAAVNEAVGRDDAAKAARKLAAELSGPLAQAVKDIETNNRDMKTSFDNIVNAWSAGGKVIKEKAVGAAYEVKEFAEAHIIAEKKSKESLTKIKEYYAGLGLSYDKLKTGLDATTTSAAVNFGLMVSEIAKTTTSSEGLNRVLGPALKATLDGIDTPEGLAKLIEEILKAAEGAGDLSGTILGTLLPALEKKQVSLEETGKTTNIVTERYANWAKVLGVDLTQSLTSATAATTETTEATKASGEAAEVAGEKTAAAVTKTENVASAKGAGLANFFNTVSEHMYSLSKEAGIAFEQNMGRSVGGSIDEYSQKSAKALENLERSMHRVTTGGIDRWVNSVAQSSYQVEADFYSQKAKVEELSQALEDTEYPSQSLINNARAAADNMNLLDDASLGGLRGQIQSAQAELLAMADAAASALASVDQSLATAKGNHAEAIEIQYDEKIRELEEQLEISRKYGSDTTVSAREETLRKTKELRDIQLKEAREREKTEKASASSKNKKTTDVNINIGGETIKAEADDKQITTLRRFAGMG